ncbi:DUF1800 domain-containing protein [Thalassorhabdomicrobium marinisediminis]|uniref:DUF1800 domain-containing protein n=1 Tax=Thalassorhabdomicrobium marinisediminis TaxID=2170577 RepID=UPI002491C40F|nr:DUF1800 domain-containing protein [Thalassorhabdomicrobium marinisediminis]
MSFDPILAAIRFGTGLSPVILPPASVDEMLDWLAGPDEAAQRFPIPTYADVYPSPRDFRAATLAINSAPDDAAEAAARVLRDDLRAAAREAVIAFIKAEMARAAHGRDGFRERLTRFWADHFTVRPVNGGARHLVSPYIEEAIRPNVAGRFDDMLIAAVESPMLILYFNQHQSMGPNSKAAEHNDRGLNENLAREVLELHTLGVGGSYGQTDVREFAELLTGVTANARNGAYFRAQQAEPGAETVLGRTYGGAEESIEHVRHALRDLARHPDTAHHLAQKLAVHFLSARPEADLIDAMARAYLDGDTHLPAMYEVMLRHASAWQPQLEKVKQPVDFVASALRALAVPEGVILDASMQRVRQLIQRPLSVMGQTWQAPVGPDGWPEADEAWVTPQGMAGRITWAMRVPERLLEVLPDPREFVFHALGPNPPEAVVFAAGAAETVSDGVGLVLASAAFQRR